MDTEVEERASQSEVQLKGLSRKEIRSRVINIAWPAVTELLLISFFGMIDMAMVGNIAEGTAAVAAIGLTNQPLFFGLATFQAMNVGATALVARSVGAGKEKDAQEATKQAMAVSLILAIVVSIFAVIYAKNIFLFMGAQEDSLSVGLAYFKIIFYGLPFQALAMVIAAALRGVGDTKIPMKINIFANIINVALNYTLIFGRFGLPRLGVTGAGIATTIARIISAVLLMVVLLKGRSRIKVSFSDGYRVKIDVIKRLFKIGLPSAAEQFILRFGIVYFTKIVAGLGTVVYASHQISLNILGLSFTPGQAFGMAAATLIGQSLGEKDPDKAEAYGRETRHLGSIVSTIMAGVFFCFGPQIVGLYTNNQDVINNASIALKIIALVQPMQSSQLILAGGLRGAGDTKLPLLSTMVGIWGIRVVLAVLFVQIFNWGLTGAWLAVMIDQIVRWLIIYVRFKSGRWKYKKV